MSFRFSNRSSFTDTIQADGSVERVYDNGLREKRVIERPGVIAWSDSRGNSGRDYYVGAGLIRREDKQGNISEGVQVGAGVISWNGGRFLAVNQTEIPEPPLPQPPPPPSGIGGFLLGLGIGKLYGYRSTGYGPYGVDPTSAEYALYAEEQARQELLRRRQMQQYDDSYYAGDDYYFYYYYGYSSGTVSSADTGSSSADFDSGSGTDSFG